MVFTLNLSTMPVMLKYFFILFIIQQFFQSYVLRSNNICKNFKDYYFSEENQNCYYDPDATLNTPQIIEKYAGVVEIHETTTEDGYILSLFRIPRSNPKGVVLIHHSIATSSRIYLWQGNNSLAMTLWHEGYDVWLANQRGTSWSDKHVNMTSYNVNYWNFDFHEMGLYDVSSEVELIRSKTVESKIIFMGHSLGSTIGLVYASMKPEEAKRYLKSMILIAPACYFEHTRGAVVVFQHFGHFFKIVTGLMQMGGSPLIALPLIMRLSKFVVRLLPIFLFITSFLVSAFCGHVPEEVDPTFYNFEAMAYLDNFSWKTIIHFLQFLNLKERRFQFYDYGKEENLKNFGTETPPLYPIEKISVPVLLISSHNDTLISLKDSETLFQELSSEADAFDHWKVSGLNHLDYHIGKHRRKIFADKLLTFLNEM